MKINYLDENKKRKNNSIESGFKYDSMLKAPKSESIQKAGSLGYAPKIVSTPKTPRVTLSDFGKNSGFKTEPALNEGARIKNQMKSLIPKMNIGIPSTIVDDIDDKTVENNISLANEALELNKRNKIYKDFMKEYPYFADAMTMAYAFDDVGNKSAVNAFKKIAYEKPENLSEPKISGNNIPTIHTITSDSKKKPEIETAGNVQNKNLFSATSKDKIDSGLIRRFTKKKVTADSLNIRSKPGFSGGINGSFLNGEEITVDMDSAVKADGYTWVEIKVDGKEGWVASEYLEDVKMNEKPETQGNVAYVEPEEETTTPEVAPLWSDSDSVGWAFLKGILNGNNQITDENKAEEEQSEKCASLDINGINMIANMERNPSQVEYDADGNITEIKPTKTDNGYGHDVGVNKTSLKTLSSQEALELLKEDAQTAVNAIASIDADFTQDQFNALVSLRYNIGYLSNIDGFLEYLEAGKYDRDEMRNLINGYYDKLVTKNPGNKENIDGWYRRTEKMLNIFFDGDYGDMPIDAVNGKVKK